MERLGFWALVLALWAPGSVRAEEPPLQFSLAAQAPAAGPSDRPTYTLTIKESILLALKNNLDLSFESFNPRIREMDIATAKAAFDPVFGAAVNASRNRTPANTAAFIPGALLSSDIRQFNFNFTLSDKLPTGGTALLSWTNQRTRSNSISFLNNPVYNSALTLTLAQPLLKNFGIDINQTAIRVATNNRDISQSNLKTRIFDVVTNTQNAYFDLISAIEQLEVARRSVSLANELVTLNRARVRAGVAAPVEVIQAESQAAAQEQNVLIAAKAVKDAEDNLRVIMNLPSASVAWDATLLPAERPPFQVVSVDAPESLRTALSKRTELEAAKIDVANKELNRKLARNQLLPDLSFVGSAGLVGQDGIKRINNGPIIEVGGAGSSILDNFSARYNNWSAGLNLTVPLGNRAAEAGYTQTVLQEDQSRVAVRNLELQITAQVREAARRIETNAKRVEAARLARTLAEEQLRIEERRLRAGVTTTFNVLQFQRDLTSAQAVEVQAVNEYQKSLANLERVQGTALEKFRIEL
jgi:outer membrane protein TolC